MNKRTFALYPAFPLALLFGVGAAQAQLKAPATSPAKDGLGSGLGSGLISSPPAPASPLPSPAVSPAATPAPAAAEKTQTGDEVVQEIANCVLAGLPPEWALAQIEVREIGRSEKQREFEAFYSYQDGAGKAAPFTPCDPREPALNVYKLNAALEPAKRNWVRATLVLSKEGKFELQYDYTAKEAGAATAPAAKPAASEAKKSAKKDAKKN